MMEHPLASLALLLLGTTGKHRFSSAISSEEIPRGSSKEPGSDMCGLPSFPSPTTLADCTDPIGDIPDHRGNWSNEGTGHWQLIEQCGDRYTVSGPGMEDLFFVHDFPRADGTLDGGVDDFNAAAFPDCVPINAAGNYGGPCMNMTVPTGQLAASRCVLEDGTLQFFNLMLGTQILSRQSASPTPSPPTAMSRPPNFDQDGQTMPMGIVHAAFLKR